MITAEEAERAKQKQFEMSITYDITTKMTEENDRFIFETIYPFCCEKAKMVLKKSDLEEALLIWKAYKDGRLEWKPVVLPTLKGNARIGKWLHKNDDYFDWLECPFCEYGSEGEVKYGRGTPFCPQCGADLTEGQEA